VLSRKPTRYNKLGKVTLDLIRFGSKIVNVQHIYSTSMNGSKSVNGSKIFEIRSLVPQPLSICSKECT